MAERRLGFSAAEARCMKGAGPIGGGPTRAAPSADGGAADGARRSTPSAIDQVVRVLVVDERRVLERLAGLERLRRADVAEA